jgi:hypothetical protein
MSAEYCYACSAYRVQCPNCRGKGIKDGKQCVNCNGVGKVCPKCGNKKG